MYLHGPDKDIPISDTLAGVAEAHRRGLFKRFGLSNFKADEVREVIAACDAAGCPKPSVYQGNYSAVARRIETEVFPVLREHGISFSAYSPLAGGLLTKTPQQIKDGVNRFRNAPLIAATPKIGHSYREMYGSSDAYFKMLETWKDLADKAGCSRAELAYRWIAFHSALDPAKGDALIVGASRPEQLEQTLAGIEKGPLSDEIVEHIRAIWPSIKDAAPLDNFHG